MLEECVLLLVKVSDVIRCVMVKPARQREREMEARLAVLLEQVAAAAMKLSEYDEKMGKRG